MMKTKIFILTFLLFSSASLIAKTKEQILGEGLSLYKKGDYAEAIKNLDSLTQYSETRATAHYMKGLCYNKLQEFDLSENEFKKAIHYGATAQDIHYERGQALFATQDLDKARKSFAHSVQNNYLTPSSLYYMGHISQVLEQYNTAMKYYRQIDPKEKEVTQAAQFQIGEIILEQAEKHPRPKEIISQYALPQLENAYQVASNSSLAGEIYNKIQEVKERYDLDENKLISGKKVSDKRLSLSYKQEVVFDSNVITEADESTQKAEDKSSIILKSDAGIGYFWPFFRRIIIEPKLRLTLDHHATNRTSTNITKNDADSIQPRVETKFEHLLKNRPATFSIAGEYNYTQRRNPPYTGTIVSGKSFYSRTTTISIAEKLNVFSLGDSTFTIKRKEYTGQTAESESTTSSFSFLQTALIPEKKLVIAMLNLDNTVTPNNTTNSQDVLLVRFDYIDLDCFWGVQCNPALSITLTDTKKQRSTRGIEQTLAPSLAFTKNITDKIEWSAKYEYTKNLSKAKTTNAYTKHATSTYLQIKY